MFSTGLDNFLPFSSNLKLSSAKSFNLEESKICHLVMGELFTMFSKAFFFRVAKTRYCLVKGGTSDRISD